MTPGAFRILAGAVLSVHLLWILWVVLGAVLTRRRRILAGFHLISLVYGVIIEAGPWPCPLTLLEAYFEGRAGITPYSQGFLVHYLEMLVYPDVPANLLTGFAIVVLLLNSAVYMGRFRTRRRKGPALPCR